VRTASEATVDPTLARLLGRPPRDVRDYIADHGGQWARSDPSRRIG
jgi:hypothetical protein